MLIVPRVVHVSAGLACDTITATWLTQDESVLLNCSTIRMNSPDTGSYITCGYCTEKPDVLSIIALMFM